MLSIVIPHLDEECLLLQCMLAVHRELIREKITDFEFIICDNSHNGYEPDAMLGRVFGWNKIKIIKGLTNQAWARLAGLDEASGEYILMLDSHTIVDKGILKESLKLMNEKPEVYLIHFGNINNGGGKFEYIYGNTWLIQNFFTTDYIFETQKPHPIDCQYSLCMFMRKDVLNFIDVETEREYFGYSMEEPNLGYRIWCMGKEVWLIPSIINIHNSGSKKSGNMPLEEQRLTTAYVLGGDEFYEKWLHTWLTQGAIRSGWKLDKEKVSKDREFILKNAKYRIQELPVVWSKVAELWK